jgi:hypothetical protein
MACRENYAGTCWLYSCLKKFFHGRETTGRPCCLNSHHTTALPRLQEERVMRGRVGFAAGAASFDLQQPWYIK